MLWKFIPLIYNNFGPNTDPWGTPQAMSIFQKFKKYVFCETFNSIIQYPWYHNMVRGWIYYHLSHRFCNKILKCSLYQMRNKTISTGSCEGPWCTRFEEYNSFSLILDQSHRHHDLITGYDNITRQLVSDRRHWQYNYMYQWTNVILHLGRVHTVYYKIQLPLGNKCISQLNALLLWCCR